MAERRRYLPVRLENAVLLADAGMLGYRVARLPGNK
jgi:hypothetical protein